MKRVLILCCVLAGMLIWLPASVVAQDATATPGATIHVVQRGETLFHIALQYGLSVDDLARVNGISDPANISIGQRLLIPIDGATVVPTTSIVHIVQPGESFDSIAQLYGMTVSDLKAQNHLDDNATAYVGEMLDVSANATQPPPTEAPDAATSTPEPVIVHTVMRGESLGKIARQYGVTVNAIVVANHIANPDQIYAGQDLVIPGVTPPKIALDVPQEVTGVDVAPLLFVEGETGRIHLTTGQAVTISGTFINQNLNDAVNDSKTDHTILVGVPVHTASSVYPLDLTLTDESGTQTPLTINIQIISGGYGNQNIHVASSESNLLDPAVNDAELATLQQITSNFTPTRYFDGQFGLPVAAPLSAPFGDTRVYNGGALTSYHTGTDFAAAPGTPIMAAAAGKVVFAGPLEVRGNATIIDHGWGVFTVYCHQTEQYVKAGDMVTAGQVIGTTGSTGRVTGPHLHWEVWVNGVVVDAMQWVNESFSS